MLKTKSFLMKKNLIKKIFFFLIILLLGLYLLQTDCPCFYGNYEECGRNECIEISNQIDKRDEKIKDPIFNDQRFEYTPQTQR